MTISQTLTWKGASLEDTLVCNNGPPTPEWLMREDTRDIIASKKQFWCYKWDCDCDWDWVLLVASKCRAPYGANNSWKQENVTCVTDISNIRKTWQGVGWGELLGLHTKDGGGVSGCGGSQGVCRRGVIWQEETSLAWAVTFGYSVRHALYIHTKSAPWYWAIIGIISESSFL